MTRRQIDQAREIRQWITKIVMPIGGAIGYVMYKNPQAREAVVTKFNDVRRKIIDLFKK